MRAGDAHTTKIILRACQQVKRAKKSPTKKRARNYGSYSMHVWTTYSSQIFCGAKSMKCFGPSSLRQYVTYLLLNIKHLGNQNFRLDHERKFLIRECLVELLASYVVFLSDSRGLLTTIKVFLALLAAMTKP